MHPRDPRLDPAEIAATTESVRALARRLVRDGAAAEDVAQEAWLVALEGGRPAEVPLRWWLSGVARNLAFRLIRGESRRRNRERAASRPESVPGDASAAASRAEAQQRIAAAVLALDEPYRSVVLLRYFEGLSPGEIAARRGVRPGTVRMQVRRGLDLLRGRMDRESAGGRRAWALALLPLLLLRREAIAATMAGGILMKATTKAGIAAAALALVAGATWLVAGRSAAPAGLAPDSVASRDEPAPVARAVGAVAVEIPDSPAPAASETTVRVSVRAARGDAVAGASVAVWSGFPASVLDPVTEPPARCGAATTGPDGTVRIDGIPPRTQVAVVVESRGHATAVRRMETPPAAGHAEVEVLLRSASTLRGRVLSPQGTPIAGATVQIGTGWPWRTETDPEGRYELADLPWGTHEVRAARPRMVPLRVAEVILPLDADLDVVLLPAATLAGTVRETETGRALAGARVEAGIWWGRSGSGEAVTDATGRYVIDTLPEGVVNQVTVTLSGFHRPPQPAGAFGTQIGVFAGRTTEHDVEMFPSRNADGAPADARIEGLVRGPRGPVAGAEVRAQGVGGLRQTRSAGDGTYAFPQIPPGKWSLSARVHEQGLFDEAYARATSTRDWSHATVEVPPAATVVHDFTCSAGVAIVGRIVDLEGRPIEGARFGTAATDAEGRFRVAGLPPGTRESWYVSAPGHVQVTHVATAPSAGDSEEVVVTLEPFGVVRGSIRTRDGTPIPPNLEIRVVARTGGVLPGPTGAPDVRTSMPVAPDGGGTFVAELLWVGSGSFVVEAQAPGWPQCVSAPVPIERGRSEYAVDLVLDQGVEVSGRILDDETGEPLAGASIASGGPRIDIARALSGADGTFRLRGLGAGAPRIAVHVRVPGYVPWDGITESASPVPFVARLIRSREIAGKVVGEDGRGVAGIRVSLGSPQGRSCVSDSTGAFILRDLGPEATPLLLSPASPSGPDIRNETVDAVLPDTRDLVLVVHPGLRISGRVVLAAGAGAADVAVTARPTGAPRGRGEVFARTASDGEFTLAGLAAGPYDLVATPNRDSPYAGESAGCFPARAEGIDAGTTDLLLTLTRGLAITGNVFDEAGRALGGIWLESGGRTTRSAEDGSFEITGLPPGRHVLRTAPSAQPDGPAQVTGGEDVAAGASGVRLVGIRGVDLVGRVVGDDGVAIPAARIELTGARNLRRSATSADDGSFRVLNLPNAPVSIVVDAPGRVPVRRVGIDPSSAPQFVLPAGGRATGALLREDGTPLGETWIDFVVEGEDHLRREARTDAEGRFRVEGLDRREYRAVALVRSEGDVRRIDAGSVRAGTEGVRLLAR